MSKLGDRIRKASRLEPAPMGFAAAAAQAAAPSMLVVVRLGSDAGKTADAIAKGADVVLVDADAGKLRGAKLPDGAIVGVAAGGVGLQDAAALREAGADFLVIDGGSRGEALLDEKLGFVMSVSADEEDTKLRLLGELSLEALLVKEVETPVSVAGMLSLRRIASFVRAPLFVEIDAKADAGLLHLLRDAGAIGVVVPASDIGKLGELREKIAGIRVRGRKREEPHAEPLVPAQAMTGDHDEDDDYDDD
jgi:hypothetical protein